VDVVVDLPQGGLEWVMGNVVGLRGELGDRYPACNDDLTPELQLGLNLTVHHYNAESGGAVERFRMGVNERMADLFEQVDFVVTASNPDVAFPAGGPMPTTMGDVDLIQEYGFERALGNNAALSMPANLSGNPAISVPAGTVGGIPVGLQIIGRHHQEQLLLDLALMVERDRPWPLVAPGSPV
jgi:Asp-tRNA(Asn)/Glu-tRNA(Gln) amidotransferase A subunit family amidase